ncbi:T9SS type A sorting domain-containing protein [Phaeocystidibacter marisrubri]|uniref:T9SS type A sorting domain-containing protein n=1 Tax=Phaeocystidibacter marisrubri TaxID=1577780 RepID=A0A6L3ZJ33_9FLAO|nr:T9SS type A sorting domain-containing protein [Phaeocystidibacter marisrubri]KAB2817643.1 T9SS type A sorting domain-containing protein [Phaeocystidibacter marisrubri]
MKKSLLVAGLFAAGTMAVSGQTRYVDEVFTNADITVTADVPYGVNFSAYVPAAMGGPQVIPLYMDIYQPDTAIDNEMNRPVVMYFHTGSFLPKGLVSPMGGRKDSAAVEICQRFARMGYVAASVTYRLGWQPNNTSNLDLRRGSNLMAVYNAVQDAKNAVRYIRASQLAMGNPLRVDHENIYLIGQGSGGYITFAYATIDKLNELTTPTKFQYQDTVGIFGGKVNVGDPYVDTSTVGDWDGFGGKAVITGTNSNGLPVIDFNAPGRNIENIAGVPSNVRMVINMGGALGDQSWLEAGDVPMLSVHCVYDFYAPYVSGMVRVPVNGQFWDVVEVAGSYTAIKKANMLFNNYVFQRENYTDPTWTISKNHPANPDGLSGIYPIGIQPADPNLPFAVNSNPWDFWDPSDPLGANETNPNIKSQSLAYIDTVMDFITPRMKTVMDANDISVVEAAVVDFKMYPNPSNGDVRVRSEELIQSVRVIDVTGRVVFTAEPNSNDFRFDASNWTPGVYIVQVKSEKLTGTERLSVY